MSTWVVVLIVWFAASVLLTVAFALGAGVGYRRAVEELRRAASEPSESSECSESGLVVRLDEARHGPVFTRRAGDRVRARRAGRR